MWQVKPDQCILFSWNTWFFFRFHPVVLVVTNFLSHTTCIPWCMQPPRFVHTWGRTFERDQGLHGWTRGKPHMLNNHENTSFPGSWALPSANPGLLTQLAPTFPHMTCRYGSPLFRRVILYDLWIRFTFVSESNTIGHRAKHVASEAGTMYTILLENLIFSSGSTPSFGLKAIFCLTAGVYLGVYKSSWLVETVFLSGSNTRWCSGHVEWPLGSDIYVNNRKNRNDFAWTNLVVLFESLCPTQFKCITLGMQHVSSIHRLWNKFERHQWFSWRFCLHAVYAIYMLHSNHDVWALYSSYSALGDRMWIRDQFQNVDIGSGLCDIFSGNSVLSYFRIFVWLFTILLSLMDFCFVCTSIHMQLSMIQASSES